MPFSVLDLNNRCVIVQLATRFDQQQQQQQHDFLGLSELQGTRWLDY
jgi:hypothetical protein